MLEWDSVSLYCSSNLAVLYGAFQALKFEAYFQADEDLQSLTITNSMALFYPILASIGLLLFFYFFSVTAFVIMISLVFTVIIAISILLYPIINFLNPNSPHFTLRCVGAPLELNYYISGFIAFVVLIMWFITGHWILNNVIGLSIGIFSISCIRITNLKVVCIAFLCLFFYDIFWVFYSEKLFGENVMLKVANAEAYNPMNTIASKLGLVDYVVKSISLPMKLIWGSKLLGIGDIVLPGTLVAYCLKLDRLVFKNEITKGNLDYFRISMVGYAIGLLCAIIAAFVYRIAQPALLYLVPSTLLPIVIFSWNRKQLWQLWSGSLIRYSNSSIP